jgi:phosphoenolpyruvate synthase/pyruvate phosphate dikinase
MEKINFISPILKGFNPKEYHFFGLWKQNLFSECFWVNGWSKEMIEKLGINAEESGILILRDGNFFVKDLELENIKKQIYRKIDDNDEAFFKQMVEVANIEYKSALEYAQTIKNKQLTPEDFLEFVTVARRVNFLWFLGAEQFSEAAQSKLSDIVVEESFPADKVSEIIPKFETPLNQQHRDILKLKKEVGDKTLEEVRIDTVLYSKLKEHATKFAWIEISNFVGESLTVERVYEQIIHTKEEPPLFVEKDYEVSSKLAFHALCLSYCGYIRQAGAEYFFMLAEKAQPYLKSIAKKFDLTYAEFLLQRETEILEALKGNINPNKLKTNAKRRESSDFVMFSGVGNEVFFVEESEDIKILKEVMLPKVDKNNKEIHGQIGNKGVYMGPARIIMNTHDFTKMQVGDVLVSTMTTPDFVVLMHKAGAIVTEIGGMLCHAAIVSREINKPCIIGTKFATQVLHDGDLVEVDADNGVVRIIKCIK